MKAKMGATMSKRATSLAERLKDSVLGVTKDWAKQRKAEERHASALENRRARLIRASDYYNFRSAAFEIMETAYLAASANDTLPALARQVMYQARPFIQDKMGGQQLNDQYFCQQLLPDYIEEYGVEWDVVYDERGHFIEPHTDHSIGLGTLSVRDYVNGISDPEFEEPSFSKGSVTTSGPVGCFGGVLLTEKEGFTPLFEAVALAKRFDLALMSPKGMSSTAARTLIDHLCKHRIPLFVLHDFDKAGFSIIGTLKRDTRRYSFDNIIRVIDLGLRLKDVRELGLESSAEAAFDRGSHHARLKNLLLNGATREEAEFLLTRRVELNALPSDQLVAFIERKLTEHGIKKVIPKSDLLGKTYQLLVNNKRIEEAVAETISNLGDENIDVPSNLKNRVEAHLREHPELRWDEAVAAIVEKDQSLTK
jgi:Topoisomerase 6 subunit A/Spo11, Toprim domain